MRSEQEEPEGWAQGGGRAGRPAAAEGLGQAQPSGSAVLGFPPIPLGPSGHLKALGEEEAWGQRSQGMVMTRWPGSTPFPSTSSLASPRVPPPRAGSLLSL